MKKYLENEKCFVTDNLNLLEKEHTITEDLSYWLNRMHIDVAKNKTGTADRLIKLIQKHPKNPQLKNLLTAYYQKTNQLEKAYELNRKTLKLHPDYFFAKLNLANEYLNNGQHEKVKDLLGESFSIKQLYPERDTFHISEIMSMYKVGVQYYAVSKQFDIAKAFIVKMREIDKQDFEVENAEHILMNEIFKTALEQKEKEKSERISVKTKEYSYELLAPRPTFNHNEVEEIYRYDAAIPLELISNILTLPRQTLAEDLVSVINDGINRFDEIYRENLDSEHTTFIFHSINLLAEIGASDKLDDVLNILRQDEEFLQNMLEDYLTECIWMALYKIGNNQLNVLELFMKESGVYTYSKTEISKALAQIALHQPERRDEVISWYKSIFEFYVQAEIEDNVIDSELIGLMVADVIDFKGKELLPQISMLFNKKYVGQWVCGTKQDVENALIGDISKKSELSLLTLPELYTEITTTWSGYTDSYQNDIQANKIDDRKINEESEIRSTKIGRNDPCPCNSGKKYKKCCLKA